MKTMDAVPAGALTAALALLPAGAGASPSVETRILDEEGGWRIELTRETQDGGLWCSAEAVNAAGQSLVLAAYDTGGLALFVFDPGWAMGPRALEIGLEIDGGRRVLAGAGEGIGVTMGLEEPRDIAGLLLDLRRAREVVVTNAEGARLAAFPLDASETGIEALMTCWERILTPPQESPEALGALT